MYLAKAGGQEVALPEPITREELFLAKLAGQAVETPEPITRKEMFLAAAIENGGGTGGGAEVKTCNVRFVAGDSSVWSSWGYAYTKHENGVTSLCRVEDIPEKNFDIILENVVCGSIIIFPWSGDAETAEYDKNMIVPIYEMSDQYSYYVTETATDFTITLYGDESGWDGGIM